MKNLGWLSLKWPTLQEPNNDLVAYMKTTLKILLEFKNNFNNLLFLHSSRNNLMKIHHFMLIN